MNEFVDGSPGGFEMNAPAKFDSSTYSRREK